MTLIGSGVYSWDWEGKLECPTCKTERDGTFYRDDWQSEWWTCWVCDNTFRLPLEEPEYNP